MNRTGSIDTGIYLLFAAGMGLLVLAALAPTTGAILSDVGASSKGVAGFVVNNFNLVLLLAITIIGFIGIASFRGGD